MGERIMSDRSERFEQAADDDFPTAFSRTILLFAILLAGFACVASRDWTAIFRTSRHQDEEHLGIDGGTHSQRLDVLRARAARCAPVERLTNQP
jgi:hypothetical protein